MPRLAAALALVAACVELLLGLSEGLGQFGELLGTEEEQDDREDEEKFGSLQVHAATLTEDAREGNTAWVNVRCAPVSLGSCRTAAESRNRAP